MVRIFEGIIGVFQDAHFSKRLRIFEQGAHLRSRAAALGYPRAGALPFSRKVVQTLASALIALCCVEMNVIDKPAAPGAQQHASHHSAPPVQGCLKEIPNPKSKIQNYESPARKQKSRAWIFDPGTAPRMRDLQLVAVPYFFVR